MSETYKFVTSINMSSFNQASIHNQSLILLITTSNMNGIKSQSTKISLKSKGKMKYVNETAKSLAGYDLKYEVSDAENSFLMPWSLHQCNQKLVKLLAPTYC